jgi:hypothetical protein
MIMDVTCTLRPSLKLPHFAPEVNEKLCRVSYFSDYVRPKISVEMPSPAIRSGEAWSP